MKTSYQYFNAHANSAMHMQMMQCMHDFSSTHTSQREGVRAATTLLINVRCCTGTYRTNSVVVSSNAYQREEYVLHVLYNSITVHIIYFKLEQSKANNFQFQII